jgi:hypothetical protein
MRTTIAAVAIATAFAAPALTACGNGPNPASEPTVEVDEPTEGPTTAPPRAAGDPDEQKTGVPFEFLIETEEGAAGQAVITVTVSACQKNRGFDIDTSYEEPRTYTAPQGMRYFNFRITVRNTGKLPTQFSPSGQLLSADGTTYDADDDMTNELGYVTGEAARNRLNFPGVNTVEVNPAETAQTAVVFLAPEAFKPAALVLTDNSEPINFEGEAVDALVAMAGGEGDPKLAC